MSNSNMTTDTDRARWAQDAQPMANGQLLLDAGRSEAGWHRVESAIRCPRLFAWKEIEGIRGEISAPLVRGSLLHIGLAHHYARVRERQTGGDPERWLAPDAAIATLAEKNSEESPLWMDCAPAIIDVYFAYRENWGQEDWKILEVENQMKARVGEKKHLYTQRADLTIEDPHGRVWIVDHKSAYRINSATLRQHLLDGQFLGYQLFGKAKYGKRFAGVLVNRVKLTPRYDFDRRALEPSPSAYKWFVRAIEEGEKRIAENLGKPPMEWPMAISNQICFGKYGACDAFDLCRFGEEP